MTIEEALMAILAGVAGILLFIGLAQSLDGRSPRYLGRRHRTSPERGASRPSGAVSGAAGRQSPRSPDRSGIPFADLVGESPEISSPPGSPLEPAPVSEAPPPPPPLTADRPPADERAALEPTAAAPSDRELTLVERCASLCLAGKHGELLLGSERRLDRDQDHGASGPSHTMTALWSLAALGHRALGDDALASSALALGVAALPGTIVESCSPRVATMSLPIARRLIEVAEQSPDGVEDRITAPRLAAFWLRWRLVAAPGDPDSLALLESVHAALCEGYAELITASVQRHEWADARRLIQEGAAKDELPAARAAVLAEVVAASLRLEVDRLTSPAVRGAKKDESRILAGLGHADALLATMRGADLPPRQRAAMTRRIWRGYVSLGFRRLRSGRVDEAADALLRALGMSEIGRRRQRPVRDGVVSTLQAMGDQKSSAVAKLLAEGDRPAAAVEVDDLLSKIRRARESGISQDVLVAVSAKARELAERIESPSAR